MRTGLAFWCEAWQRLGASTVDKALHGTLIACWSGEHRHYHTLEHLGECLAQLDQVRPLARRPAEIEVALWFHDAVYDPRRDDNEVQSAEWARASVLHAGLGSHVAGRVHALVMATCHDEAPEDADAKLMADIDLSILGADPQRYDEYELQIRAEYAHLPDERFRTGRLRMLERLCARAAIYSTGYFQQALERQARQNLQRALARLRDG